MLWNWQNPITSNSWKRSRAVMITSWHYQISRLLLMPSNQTRMRTMNLFTRGISLWIIQEKNVTCLIMHNIVRKIIDCFEQCYDNLFGKDANVNINLDEGDHVLFDVACLLNCNVWQNSGETEEKSCDRQLKLLQNMISHYGGWKS